jgi:hypothetical protein
MRFLRSAQNGKIPLRKIFFMRFYRGNRAFVCARCAKCARFMQRARKEGAMHLLMKRTRVRAVSSQPGGIENVYSMRSTSGPDFRKLPISSGFGSSSQ